MYTIWLSVSLGFIVVLLSLLFQKMSNGLFSHSIIKCHQTYYKSTLLHSALALFSSAQSKPPKGLPEVKTTEQISDNVTRILGLNPGPHTLQGTNTYLLGTSTSKILVDTGESKTAKEYISLLLDEIFPSTQTTSLSHILLTHGHADHQGGLEELFSELKRRNMLPLPTIHKLQSPTGSFPIKKFPVSSVLDIQNGDTFSTEGATLQALHSPGHTDDHVCFILKENHALLSGDCILGCGSAVFEDLHSYMNSLKRLRLIMIDGYDWRCTTNNNNTPLNCQETETESEIKTLIETESCPLPITAIYPGHGPVLSTAVIEKVDEYIAHREERERQIVEYLEASHSYSSSNTNNNNDSRTSGNSSTAPSSTTNSSHSGNSPWRSSWEIMSAIYPSSLPMIIKVSAQHNVQHHLTKLETDGVVSSAWPDLWTFTKNKKYI